MAEQNTAAYYQRRAKAARAMADRALDPSIRKIHLELARNYDMLSDSAEARSPALKVVAG